MLSIIKSLSLITLALALSPLVFSAPNPPPAFHVTNLNTFEPSGRPGQVNLYRVGFNVSDPSDSVTTFCETRWEYADAMTGYPSSFVCLTRNRIAHPMHSKKKKEEEERRKEKGEWE